MINDSELPLIGIPKRDGSEGTRVIKFGNFTGVIFPEIYQQFVFKLHKEHPDLIAAMQMAQVKLEDGSAVGFLAKVLNCEKEVLKDMTMEVGFAILYEALKKRTSSRIIEKAVLAIADDILEEKTMSGRYRQDEEIGTALFPNADEMFEKEAWEKKRNWQERDRKRHNRGDKE